MTKLQKNEDKSGARSREYIEGLAVCRWYELSERRVQCTHAACMYTNDSSPHHFGKKWAEPAGWGIAELQGIGSAQRATRFALSRKPAFGRDGLLSQSPRARQSSRAALRIRL